MVPAHCGENFIIDLDSFQLDGEMDFVTVAACAGLYSVRLVAGCESMAECGVVRSGSVMNADQL